MPRLDVDLVSIDANVAADFALVGRPELLGALFPGRLLACDFVVAELARAAIVLDGVQALTPIKEEMEFLQLLRNQHRNLGLGELGAICVARSRKAVVLTNDREARKLASELGLDISGTLGILKYAVATNVLAAAEAIQVLDEMIANGSWFGIELVEEFKRDLG